MSIIFFKNKKFFISNRSFVLKPSQKAGKHFFLANKKERGARTRGKLRKLNFLPPRLVSFFTLLKPTLRSSWKGKSLC
jgi:hypothetical protein